MADKICNGCEYNNNGWCKARKTNQGLKDLTVCEFRKDNKIQRIEEYLKNRRFMLSIENTAYDRGIITGLEMALKIFKD